MVKMLKKIVVNKPLNKEDETKKLNMLQTRFTKRTKDFIGEQFSESIQAVFAQILKESNKIGE